MSDEAILHKDAPGPFYRPYWGEPRYVTDGDTVWLRVALDPDTGKATAWRCTVACAAGNHARVINVARGVDRWVPLRALMVPPDDPRHWNQASGLR